MEQLGHMCLPVRCILPLICAVHVGLPCSAWETGFPWPDGPTITLNGKHRCNLADLECRATQKHRSGFLYHRISWCSRGPCNLGSLARPAPSLSTMPAVPIRSSSHPVQPSFTTGIPNSALLTFVPPTSRLQNNTTGQQHTTQIDVLTLTHPPSS